MLHQPATTGTFTHDGPWGTGSSTHSPTNSSSHFPGRSLLQAPLVRAFATHAGVMCLIAALSVLYSWPVFQHPTETIPGMAGDNILFYWDVWRTQVAIEHGTDPLYTTCIFYPTGQSMVFHTHSILHAAFLYPIRHWVGLPGMFNLWVLASFVIGGWGAFLLGRHVFHSGWPALFVAFIFSFSPFRMSHLGNHMFLFSAHWLPFYVLFLLKTLDGRWWHAVLSGLFLSLTVWTDLHYTIHLIVFSVFTLLWYAVAWWRAGRGAAERDEDRADTFLWFHLGVRLLLLGATTSLLTAPLVRPCFEAVRSHREDDRGTSPDARDILMRSGRPANFLLPPARHPIWGWLGEENTELQLNMGYTVLVLCWVAWRCRRTPGQGSVSYWTALSILFVLLAMGPVLMLTSKYTLRIGGTEYNVPLPHALLDCIPGVNMARAPARFMGLGMLAVALVAGFGLQRLIASGRWKWALAASGLLALEFCGKPFPVLWPWTSPGLAQLAAQDGAVIDLPFGVGSALHQSGHMDYFSILSQTAHGRPRVGGMVSRCSDEYRQQLMNEPVLGSLLRMYEGQEIDGERRAFDVAGANETVRHYGIRHVLLRPNQQDQIAHRYLGELFPDAVNHELEYGTVWMELNPK
jgi:hypothetical protein